MAEAKELGVQLSTRIPARLKRDLAIYCVRAERTVQSVLAEMIATFLGKQQKGKKR